MMTRRFMSCVFGLILGMGAIATPAAAQSATDVQIARGYPLGAGDTLRVDFLVRPEIGRDIPIELNGYASFPFIDPVHVAGRTIAELRAEIPILMSGAVLRDRVGDEVQLIQLEEYDVVISVASYRPVIVSGAVKQPGNVDFAVGMTARAAIAKAFGISPLALGGTGGSQDPDALGELVVERAVLNALIADRDAVDEADITVPFGARQNADILRERANQDLALRRAVLDEEATVYGSELRTAENGVMAALARKEDLMRTARVEEGNVERLESLAARAASIYSGTLVQGRRALLAASEAFSDASSDVEKALFSHKQLMSDRKIELLNDEREWRTRLAKLNVALSGTAGNDTLGTGPQPVVTLYRQGPNGTEARAVDLDHLLMPGDLIDVHVAGAIQ